MSLDYRQVPGPSEARCVPPGLAKSTCSRNIPNQSKRTCATACPLKGDGCAVLEKASTDEREDEEAA